MKRSEAAELCMEFTQRMLAHGFDSIQVIGTWAADRGGTGIIMEGGGNVFARRGAVSAWLKDQERCDEKEARDDD